MAYASSESGRPYTNTRFRGGGLLTISETGLSLKFSILPLTPAESDAHDNGARCPVILVSTVIEAAGEKTVVDDKDRRRELGHFMRTRRERLSPKSVGLPKGPCEKDAGVAARRGIPTRLLL